MATKEQILAALATLDAKNDEHWTADGAPRIDVLKAALGEDIDRNTVILANPTFNRKAAEAAAAQVVGTQDTGDATQPPEGAADSQPKSEAEAFERLSNSDAETKDAARAEAVKAREARNERLAELSEAQMRIDNERARIHLELTQIDAFLDKLAPKENNAETIQAYLETQKRIKLARAEQANALRQMAIDNNSLTVMSPLDQAMANTKRSR
jgi:hypothetical protein